MSAGISEPVRTFLYEHLEDYVQLEVLLLLFRHPDRPWTASDVGARLNADVQAVEEALEHLRGHGLARLDPAARAFRYGPDAPGAAACVAELHRLEESDRVSVVQTMSANALERLRMSAIRAFAAAFRFRGGRDDG